MQRVNVIIILIKEIFMHKVVYFKHQVNLNIEIYKLEVMRIVSFIQLYFQNTGIIGLKIYLHE